LIECIQRLQSQGFCDHFDKTFCIHLVGADHREGNAPTETYIIFQHLFDYFERQSMFEDVKLVLIGPNLASKLHQGEYVYQLSNKNVQLYYFVGIFDEYFAHKENYVAPDLCCCFNAGVWGYDMWIPTLQRLVHEVQVPVLVTSYNKQESGDDEDIIEDEVKPGKWFWRAEKNPHGSLMERSTRNEYGSTLRENDHWLCFGPR
jgi:hypothetical protein